MESKFDLVEEEKRLENFQCNRYLGKYVPRKYLEEYLLKIENFETKIVLESR